MSAVKDFLVDLFEDLATIEVAAVYQDVEDPSGTKVIAYTRMEPGGDAVHFFDRDLFASERDLHGLHRELLLSAAGSRRELRQMLATALK